jgi:hypothetical protein
MKDRNDKVHSAPATAQATKADHPVLGSTLSLAT